MAHPPELRERAKQMREGGALVKTIASELGVPKPTVIRWLNPELEQRERERARKRKFEEKKRCPSCGKKMANTAQLCLACYRSSQRHWTRERVIEALRAWAAENGRAPIFSDWERSGKDHPAIRTITAGSDPTFKTWSEALEAAGFEPRKRRGPKWTAEKLNRQQRAELRRKNREDKLRRALAKENNANLR